MVNEHLLSISLKKEEALQYLRKEEVKFEVEHEGMGIGKIRGSEPGMGEIIRKQDQ